MSSLFAWEDRHNPRLILDRISISRKVHEGKVSFGVNVLNAWFPVLLSAIKTAPEVREYKTRCVKAALYDASISLSDDQKLLKRCVAEYRKLKQTPLNKYVLLGDITYSGERLFGSVSDGICRVEWCKNGQSSFIKKAMAERANVRHLLTGLKLERPADGLSMMKVHVEAPNHKIAASKAADSLDKVRSIINLIINQQRSLSPFPELTNKPHAVNDIRPGPYLTLHNVDGSLSTEMVWYEPRWDHDSKKTKFRKPKAIGADVRKWLKRISESPLNEYISQGLLRYCRALDSHDRDASLLGLWGVIEHLTVTQDARYDTTVKRLLKVFFDPEEAREIAEHVRSRRNRLVHASISPETDEADMVIYHADFLARRILIFAMEHGCSFETTEDLARFLDLPRDLRQLSSQGRMVKRVIKYQRALQSQR